jgi:hypothetical protein
MIAKRLRTLKHRTARWFLPPVRAPHGEAPTPAQNTHDSAPVRFATRGVKQPVSLQ